MRPDGLTLFSRRAVLTAGVALLLADFVERRQLDVAWINVESESAVHKVALFT
jgi:hypothetical protein